MTILIIDSNSTLRKKMADFLQKKGYQIIQSSNAARALGIVQIHRINIIICIKKSQSIDGIALCRNIRDQKKENYTYFMLIAKNEKKEETLEGYKQGVDAFITNTIDFRELEAQVLVGMRITGFNSPKDKKKESAQIATVLRLPRRPKQARKENNIKKEDISRSDILLAKIALEQRLVTKAQLAQAFSFQRRQSLLGKRITIGDVFLEKEMMSPKKLDNLYASIKSQCEPTRFEMKGLVSGAQTNNPPADQNLEAIKTDPENLSDYLSVDPMLQIAVSKDSLKVRIQVRKHLNKKITPDDILGFLQHNSIRYGIASIEKIETFLNTDFSENKSFVVATGKPPLPGCDASIVYHFDTDHLKAGTINDQGTIDYKERGKTPRVSKGDLLATKKSMQDSQAGIDIYSNSIPAPVVNDINCKCGEGTRLSEDGLNVYATIDGQPVLAIDGTVCVHAELTIKGDVDFNTGNVDFDGNVNVAGVIIDGFMVKCGNLTANEIVNGKIIAAGDVTIQGGIINADIKTQGSVKAKFITDSNIKSFGDVIVDKEVINSKIRSSGKFLSERGKIISSFVSAKMGFESKEIGTDISHPCRINVGLDENVKKRIQAFDHTIDDKKKSLERLQKQYEKQIGGLETNDYLKKQGIRNKEIAQDLLAIERIIKEIETISDEKQAIINWSKNEKGNPIIKVKGLIQQGTKLFGIHSSTTLRENLHNITIKEAKQTGTDFWKMMI